MYGYWASYFDDPVPLLHTNHTLCTPTNAVHPYDKTIKIPTLLSSYLKVVGVDEVKGTTFLTTGFSLSTAIFLFFLILRAAEGAVSLDLHTGRLCVHFWAAGCFTASLAGATLGSFEPLFVVVAVVCEGFVKAFLTDGQEDFGCVKRELGGGIFETALGAWGDQERILNWMDLEIICLVPLKELLLTLKEGAML